ncbi:glycosyltransferase family 39 protein [Candidatus Omnitrophota bacterium]
MMNAQKMSTIVKSTPFKVVLCLCLFLLAFAVRVRDISYRSIWMDEDRQAEYAALGVSDTRIIDLAASQQQPPLDYYLEAVGIAIFGFNEFGIRIHAVVLGALASILFFLFLARFYGFISAFAGFFLFAFNPWLLRYSVEARPYSTAVFFAVVFMFLHHTVTRERNIRNMTLFVIAQLCLLFTIGFQPVVLILIFGGNSTLAAFFFNRQKPLKEIFYTITPYCISSIVYYPLLMKIRRHSSGWYNPLSSWGSAILPLIKNFLVSGYLFFYNLIGNHSLVFLLSVVAIILWTRIQRREGSLSSKKLQLKSIVLSAAIIFPPICWLIFSLATNNVKFQPKYVLVYLPVILSIIAIGVEDGFKLIKQKLQNKRVRNATCAVFVICLLGLFGNAIAKSQTIARSLVPVDRSWRDFYSVIKQDATPGDIMVIETLIDGGFKPDWFCKDRYLGPFEEHKVATLTINDSQFVSKLKKIAQYPIPNQKLYFTFYLKGVYKDIVANQENFRDKYFAYMDIDGLTTIRYVDNDKDLLAKVTFFFEYIVSLVPETETTCRMRRQLSELYLYQDDFEKSMWHLKKLAEIDVSGSYQPYINDVARKLHLIRAKENR